MLFSLRLSLTVLHGKYLAADACGRLLSGHVCLPLSLLSPRPRSVRTAVSMAMKEVCLELGI